MKKVIITGATGLIGSHLTVELIQSGNYSVTAMVRSDRSKVKLREVLMRYGLEEPEYITVDTSNYDEVRLAVADFDVIFHCAAIVSFDSGSTEQIVSNNVELTSYIVDSCLASPRNSLLVHISSIAALGTAKYPELTTEKELFTGLASASAYSRSKFLSENEVWRGVKSGLNAVIVSPSVVLGVGAIGSEGLQPVFRMAERGIQFYTDGVVGYVDVVDVARAMRLLAENPESWGARYILSGHNLSYGELITFLNNAFGYKAPKWKVSRGLLRTAVSILGIFQRRPLVTKEMVGFLTNKTAYDGSLIERTVDFKYTLIEQTMKRIAAENSKSHKHCHQQEFSDTESK